MNFLNQIASNINSVTHYYHSCNSHPKRAVKTALISSFDLPTEFNLPNYTPSFLVSGGDYKHLGLSTEELIGKTIENRRHVYESHNRDILQGKLLLYSDVSYTNDNDINNNDGDDFNNENNGINDFLTVDKKENFRVYDEELASNNNGNDVCNNLSSALPKNENHFEDNTGVIKKTTARLISGISNTFHDKTNIITNNTKVNRCYESVCGAFYYTKGITLSSFAKTAYKGLDKYRDSILSQNKKKFKDKFGEAFANKGKADGGFPEFKSMHEGCVIDEGDKNAPPMLIPIEIYISSTHLCISGDSIKDLIPLENVASIVPSIAIETVSGVPNLTPLIDSSCLISGVSVYVSVEGGDDKNHDGSTYFKWYKFVKFAHSLTQAPLYYGLTQENEEDNKHLTPIYLFYLSLMEVLDNLTGGYLTKVVVKEAADKSNIDPEIIKNIDHCDYNDKEISGNARLNPENDNNNENVDDYDLKVPRATLSEEKHPPEEVILKKEETLSNKEENDDLSSFAAKSKPDLEEIQSDSDDDE